MAVTEPKLRDLFSKALQCRTAEEEAAYLEQVCQGDAELRARLEELLQAHRQAGSFLQEPSPARPPTVDELSPTEHNEGVEELDFLAASDKPDSLGRVGHYEVLEVIGRGGMGIVLRAFDDQLHRVVAIKVMAAQLATNATARRRFAREAQAAAAVSHDHIVTIHAVEESAPLPYLVMQYVAGLSLQQRLDRDGPLDLQEILRIGMQVASGLSAAHAQGLIHRDIKPANILLENGVERVKITDFGLARALTDASLTQSGVVAGTPQYMAPEQAEAKAVDQRTDLFSLGSVLYAMCTGRAPFRASGTMAVLKRVCEEKPTPIRESNAEVPEWLVAIIDKLHAKDPAERYQSAAEVAELLGRHLAQVQHPSVVPLTSLAPEARGAGGEGRSHSRPRRRLAIAAAVFLCLLAGLTFTEATGVTNVRGTVIRIFTPDGTLVVEINDPSVKVTVEGDGGLVITGGGLEEIRLRPGSYKVYADRDGKRVPLEREVVSIAKGGREVVRVKLEALPAPAVAKSEKGAFVLLAAGKERKFDTLADAVLGASNGDTIEIRGNGPFATAPIKMAHTAVTIRAGAGFRPVIELLAEDSQAQALLQADAPLVLEGLEFRRLDERKPDGMPWRHVIIVSKAMHAANCRFVTRQTVLHIAAWNAAVIELRNCEFLCGPTLNRTGALIPTALHLWTGRSLVLDNCLLTGQVLQQMGHPGGASMRVTRNTFRSEELTFRLNATSLYNDDREPDANADWTVKALRVEASRNLFQASGLFEFVQGPKFVLPPGDAEPRLTRMMDWQGERNAFAFDGAFLRLIAVAPWRALPPAKLPAGLAGWKALWKTTEADSVARPVHFHGGDILARQALAPEKLTPEDFRLRPDSAGYKADKDGKDLGADVDLVGPGPAYERWKKTPEYQQWLKDTKQVAKAEAPKAEPNAFVVLGGQDVPERKFDTLVEAVQVASNGDVIEVRGNGPFVTPPVNLGNRTLTFRAAPGFHPVIRLNREATGAGAPLLTTNSSLVLEGLELGLTDDGESHTGWVSRVMARGPSVSAANCRFQNCHFGITSRNCRFRNCEFVTGVGAGVLWWYPNDGELAFDNSVMAGGGLVFFQHRPLTKPPPQVYVAHCTVRAGTVLTLEVPPGTMPVKTEAGTLVRLAVSESVIDVNGAIRIQTNYDERAQLGQLAERIDLVLPNLLAWSDRQNLYAEDNLDSFVIVRAAEVIRPPSLRTLAGWDKAWGQSKTGSFIGRVRYQGGDPLAGKVTPEDFRLRADSAGYKAGKDGKDLGADVDLVGPGPAYERWKKTPEYQQWLKDTGQVK